MAGVLRYPPTTPKRESHGGGRLAIYGSKTYEKD